jgi:hypothetical protein
VEGGTADILKLEGGIAVIKIEMGGIADICRLINQIQ